jgi:hypothetical protein
MKVLIGEMQRKPEEGPLRCRIVYDEIPRVMQVR